MKKSIIIIFLLVIFFIFNCTTNTTPFEIKIISKFPDTILCKGLLTSVIDVDIIPSLYIYDTILICELYPNHSSGYLYRAYSLNNYKLLGNFLQKGNGPDEFILGSLIHPQRSRSSGDDIKIWVENFPSQVVLLNLTATLARGKTVIERKYDFIRPGKANLLYASNDLYVLDEDIFLMNIDLERSGNADSNNSGPFYVLYDYSRDRCWDTLRYSYDLPGWVSLNEDKTRIVKVSYWEDVISLYDIKTGKETIICHTKKLPDELYGLENRDVKKPEYIYRTCFFSGDLIFTLYRANEESLGKETLILPSVHIFDKDGNPLYNVSLGAPVENICFDDRTRILYGLDAEGQLYAYDLKNVLKGAN